MTLPEFKKEVWNGKLNNNIYILYGEETEVRKRYIEKIKKIFSSYVVTDDISTVYLDLSSKSIFDPEPKLFISYYDDKFTTAGAEVWDRFISGKATSNNTVIFVYEKLDKKASFLKIFDKCAVEFDLLNDNILCKYIKKDINLSYENSKYLIELCGHKYSNIYSEVTKIKNYCENTGSNVDDAFEYMLNCGEIYSIQDADIFELVDAIIYGNIKRAYYLYNLSIEHNNCFAIMSILYNSLRNILQVQNCNHKDVQKVTGLTPFAIKSAKHNVNRFYNNELIRFMRIIKYCLESIKNGNLKESEAFDYMIVQVYC